MRDCDRNLFLSADCDGGKGRFRMIGEMLCCEESAEGGIGVLTSREREGLALVDEGKEDEELDGRIEPR